MKTVTFDQFASDVATILGESLALECQPEESPFPNLKNRVQILAPGLLEKLLMETPIEKISDADSFAKSFSGNAMVQTSGCVEVNLPEDFLKLVAVKMSDWSRPALPVFTLGFNTQGNRCLRFFTVNPGASLQFFLYLPRPSRDYNRPLEIPDSLYHSLVAKVTEVLQGNGGLAR